MTSGGGNQVDLNSAIGSMRGKLRTKLLDMDLFPFGRHYFQAGYVTVIFRNTV